jgi:hypothetical protein
VRIYEHVYIVLCSKKITDIYFQSKYLTKGKELELKKKKRASAVSSNTGWRGDADRRDGHPHLARFRPRSTSARDRAPVSEPSPTRRHQTASQNALRETTRLAAVVRAPRPNPHHPHYISAPPRRELPEASPLLPRRTPSLVLLPLPVSAVLRLLGGAPSIRVEPRRGGGADQIPRG